MKSFVIDTNVLIVASERTPHASLSCIRFCQSTLNTIRNPGGIAVSLDSLGLILLEYFGNLSRSGQPGLGDAFAKWLYDHQYDQSICELVEITPKNSSLDDFEEFPHAPELADFDRSDRKFVAVARASAHNPPILNATDADWWDFRERLKEIGVDVEFLCPDMMGRS
jgi:hypothetical protein